MPIFPANKSPQSQTEGLKKQILLLGSGFGFHVDDLLAIVVTAVLAPEEKKEDLLKKLLEHYRIPFQSFSQAHLERTAESYTA